MKRTEKELIKLAFGDVEPKDAERAERLMREDPRAAKLYAGYAEIREGLKLLQTPEHQLSTERLREAILKQGLREKSPATSWRWVFAPAAVAAAAFLFALRFGGGSGLEQVPGGYAIGDRNESPEIAQPERMIEFDPDIRRLSENAFAGASTAAPVVSRPAARTESPRSAPSASRNMIARTYEQPDAKVALTPSEVSNLAVEAALPAGVAAMNTEASIEQPIVLIGAENDEATGANRAMEVSTASHVVVGG